MLKKIYIFKNNRNPMVFSEKAGDTMRISKTSFVDSDHAKQEEM